MFSKYGLRLLRRAAFPNLSALPGMSRITIILLGIEVAAEMIARIKDNKIGSGVHLMAIGAEKNVPVILGKAGLSI